MLHKIQFISDVLAVILPEDCWLMETLYKYISNELGDIEVIDFIQERFANPYEAFKKLINTLYNRALSIKSKQS